jgi:ubiquitin thioesterase protein OTUB1
MDDGLHDLAAQQAAAQDYQAELEVNLIFAELLPLLSPQLSTRCTSFASSLTSSSQGLAVGNKTSSEAITQEYAKADPVYVEKTIVC